MNSESITTKKTKYELVPPDAGWAYMIWIAAIINFTVTSAFLPSAGMIYNDFYIQLEMDTMAIQLLNGVNSMCIAISSFLTGPMSKVMSMRKLYFLSSTFLNAGIFCVVFVNSQVMLFMCQATQSIGVGMLYNVTCTSVNDYFLKKRFLISNVAQTINAAWRNFDFEMICRLAAAAMTVPMAVHWTTETYGPRGTLIIISAVSIQTFVGSSLIQPVEWHKKKVHITPGRESIELLEIGCKKFENSQSVTDLEQPKMVLSYNTPKVVDDNNFDDTSSIRKGNNVVLTYIKDIFDWPFLKTYLRTCTCLGLPLSLISDVMFTTFLPQALYSYEWGKEEVAWGLSILAFGDLTARVVLMVASAWLVKLGSRLIYIIGMAIDVLAKLVLLCTSNASLSYITLCLIGCSRCILLVLFPLVISDTVPAEQYTSVFGFCMFIYGSIGITLGPAIGAVRDATGDYRAMFYVLVAIMAAVTFAWSLEMYHQRKKKNAYPRNVIRQN